MDVFDLVATRPEPTIADRKLTAARNITEMTVQFAGGVVAQLNEMYAQVWDSPLKIAPEQVCDALGDKGASMFRRHGAFVAFIASELPQLLPLVRVPPADATITYETDADGNETGRVIISRSE